MAVIDYIFFTIYRWLLIPSAILFLKMFRAFWPEKMRQTVEDRKNRVMQALPSRPIWIHASSGEIEYARSVIRELRRVYPQATIMVTYFSPSAKTLLTKIPEVNLTFPLPFDKRGEVIQFLKFYNPRCALFARTDIWPELSYQLFKFKIPSLIFSTTIAKKSGRLKWPTSHLTRWSFNHLTHIQTVSPEDRYLLTSLGVKTPIEVTGDTRYDQVFFRLENSQYKIQWSQKENSLVLVMGSTWPEDEEKLIPSLKSWINKGHRAILVPHEVNFEHLQKIQTLLRKNNINYNLFTDIHSDETQVLLVNKIGYLQELYKFGHIAFVGGSFKQKIHSVMEALCLGLPVIVGPYYENNREAVEFSDFPLEKGLNAVNPVKNQKDIERVLSLLENIKTPHPLLLAEVNKKRNSTWAVMKWIQHQINL